MANGSGEFNLDVLTTIHGIDIFLLLNIKQLHVKGKIAYPQLIFSGIQDVTSSKVDIGQVKQVLWLISVTIQLHQVKVLLPGKLKSISF